MKQNRRNQKIEKDQNVKANIESQKYDILSNMNDLNETSFSYQLFEDGIFNCEKLDFLIVEAKNLHCYGCLDDNVRNTIKWIINCTNQCFISHHDQSDLYVIKNYSQLIESNWNQVWRKQLFSVANS